MIFEKVTQASGCAESGRREYKGSGGSSGLTSVGVSFLFPQLNNVPKMLKWFKNLTRVPKSPSVC